MVCIDRLQTRKHGCGTGIFAMRVGELGQIVHRNAILRIHRERLCKLLTSGDVISSVKSEVSFNHQRRVEGFLLLAKLGQILEELRIFVRRNKTGPQLFVVLEELWRNLRNDGRIFYGRSWWKQQ